MSDRPIGCKARVVGDQHICDRCGTQWDLNDNDPPKCLPKMSKGLRSYALSRRRNRRGR